MINIIDDRHYNISRYMFSVLHFVVFEFIYRIKRAPLKPGGERRYSGRVPVPAPKNAFNYELPIALIDKLSFYFVFVFHITFK
jgi:hypothetical protein